MEYHEPIVVDYGDLLELTAAIGLFGSEDGGTKVLPFHHNITTPPALP